MRIDLNRAHASTAELRSQRFRSRQISVSNHDLFKVAGAREIACRFRPHRATTTEDDDSHEKLRRRTPKPETPIRARLAVESKSEKQHSDSSSLVCGQDRSS